MSNVFSRSKTIFFARLYSFLGIIVAFHDFALPYFIGTDWTPFIIKAHQYIPGYMIPLLIGGTGILLEIS